MFGGMKDYFCDLMPSCLQCCRNGRNERALMLAREKLEKETNIIQTIQTRRYLEAAIKMLLPRESRKRLKE